MEIGSGRVEVEDEGAGVLGGFSALGVLGEDPIENRDVLLPTDDRLAEDLALNLERTVNPAEAIAATDKVVANMLLSLSSSSCLLISLKSSPPTEATNNSSDSCCASA